MQVQHPFAVITPTLDGDVLTLLARADAPFTTGQLQRMLPERSREGIRKVLHRLVAQGVVDEESVGPVYSYRLNRGHLASVPIIALANLRTTLIQRLEEQLDAWRPRPAYAALFGSAARGQMRPDSDIDIFLVQPDDADPETWETQTGELAAAVTRWTGNDARVLGMTEAEVRAGAAGSDPVLTSVVEEGLTVAGPPRWLRQRVRRA